MRKKHTHTHQNQQQQQELYIYLCVYVTTARENGKLNDEANVRPNSDK